MGSCRSVTPLILLIVMPADTSPTIFPRESRTGTTACTSRPMVPLTVSVIGWPASGGPVVPTNFLPIRDGRGWVKRMPWVLVTTMKSTPDVLRAASARGWSTAVGSLETTAAATPGAFAKVCATARERVRASWALSCRDWTKISATPEATSSSTMTAWRTKTWPATLRTFSDGQRNRPCAVESARRGADEAGSLPHIRAMGPCLHRSSAPGQPENDVLRIRGVCQRFTLGDLYSAALPVPYEE